LRLRKHNVDTQERKYNQRETCSNREHNPSLSAAIAESVPLAVLIRLFRHAATVSPLSPSTDWKNAYTSNSYSEEEQNHVADFYYRDFFSTAVKITQQIAFISKHGETS
jgi:hypothetical protein